MGIRAAVSSLLRTILSAQPYSDHSSRRCVGPAVDADSVMAFQLGRPALEANETPVAAPTRHCRHIDMSRLTCQHHRLG